VRFKKNLNSHPGGGAKTAQFLNSFLNGARGSEGCARVSAFQTAQATRHRFLKKKSQKRETIVGEKNAKGRRTQSGKCLVEMPSDPKTNRMFTQGNQVHDQFGMSKDPKGNDGKDGQKSYR